MSEGRKFTRHIFCAQSTAHSHYLNNKIMVGTDGVVEVPEVEVGKRFTAAEAEAVTLPLLNTW